MTAAPGAAMDYSTGNTHLLSAILTRPRGARRGASPTTCSPAARLHAAAVAGDPQGIYFGGNDMLMTSRQLLAFGELYLNGGRVKGRQVVPEAWVRRSCRAARASCPRGLAAPARRASRPLRDAVWLRLVVHDLAGHETCFAWGSAASTPSSCPGCSS